MNSNREDDIVRPRAVYEEDKGDTATNHDLQLAFDFVKYTNRNIFLTGKAGTGKTTFLRDLKTVRKGCKSI